MNHMPPPDKSGVAVIGEPSLADVMAAIATATDLPDRPRRDWPTSIRKMAEYLGHPLVTLPARITALSRPIQLLRPAILGVNDKTFANHRANLRAALCWFLDARGVGRGAPMDPRYREMLAGIANRYGRDQLSPFFRYLTAVNVAPDDVEDPHVAGFLDYRRHMSFSPVKPAADRQLAGLWNACQAKSSAWPRQRLREAAVVVRRSGPAWEEFPESLREDIEAQLLKLGTRRKSTAGRRRVACKSSTIETRRRELQAACRTAVGAGIPIERITSLRQLLQPDIVSTVIDGYWKRNGEMPSKYTIQLAWRFLDYARQLPDVTQDELEELDEIWESLKGYDRVGLTSKNQNVVYSVLRGGLHRRIVELPELMMPDARARRISSPLHSAVEAELAISIAILTFAPVRMANLATIQLGHNLVRPGGAGTRYRLTFPHFEVKNGVDLDFDLPSVVSDLIDEFIHDFRPSLLRGHNHNYLFPGQGGGKLSRGLSEQITRRLNRELGLRITPHQFRHIAAGIILLADPGNFELIRRVLGHRHIQTTMNYYAGLETLGATERFGEMVTVGVQAFRKKPR